MFIPAGLALLAVGFGGGVVYARRPTATLTPTQTNTPSRTPTATATSTMTPSPSPSATPTPFFTATPSQTATITLTPTITPTASNTPTITPTPVVRGRVSVQSNCRYGPGSAYLYEWGLFPGNRVTILGRNQDASWVYVDPWNYTDYCWMKASLLEISGDVHSVPEMYTLLPFGELYWPPQDVSAVRDGDQVTVFWTRVPMTLDDDRGYLIEAWLCQDGQVRFTPLHFWSPPALLHDEAGCLQPSSARIYTAEKHGYTRWVKIPWPQHEGTPSPTPPRR